MLKASKTKKGTVMPLSFVYFAVLFTFGLIFIGVSGALFYATGKYWEEDKDTNQRSLRLSTALMLIGIVWFACSIYVVFEYKYSGLPATEATLRENIGQQFTVVYQSMNNNNDPIDMSRTVLLKMENGEQRLFNTAKEVPEPCFVVSSDGEYIPTQTTKSLLTSPPTGEANDQDH